MDNSNNRVSFKDKIINQKQGGNRVAKPNVSEQPDLSDIDFDSEEFQEAFNEELTKMGFSSDFYKEYQKVMGGFTDNLTQGISSEGTVKEVFDASTELMSSDEMMSLIIAINSSDNPNENLLMNNHILSMIFSKKDEGISNAITYIDSLLSGPEYSEKSSYLEEIKENLTKLKSNKLLERYFIAQEAFNNDDSEEAKKAREIAVQEGQKVQDFLSGEAAFKEILEEVAPELSSEKKDDTL